MGMVRRLSGCPAMSSQGIIDLADRAFGRLTAVRATERRDASGRAYWLCRCECGKEREALGRDLRCGRTTSCGCKKSERARTAAQTHGRAGTPEYRSWQSMLTRCTNPSYHRFDRYGGRGITVCAAWANSFERFMADMGQRPAGTTLDRFPNNDGNYEPGNCRWATPAQQRQNRSVKP